VIDSGDRKQYVRVLAIWAAVLAALFLFQEIFG
jgi:hypothetical protein